METYKVAPLMPGGIVTSLEILGVNKGMGHRGSKIDSLISVKEQRVDGFSVCKKYCKVYSRCQGNLVFIHYIKYVNTIIESIQKLYKVFYSNCQIYLFFSEARSSKLSCDSTNGLNPYYVTGLLTGNDVFF
jgi:hypothetical protein